MADMNLRSRHIPNKDVAATEHDHTTKVENANPSKQKSGVGILDILRVLLGIGLLVVGTSYFVYGDIWWNRRPAWAHKNRLLLLWHGQREMTLDELQAYDGSDPKLPIYLAVNGTIYDVSASPRFYGPGGGYHIFAGRDSSRAFITGCFEEDWTSDLRGVEEMFMPRDLDLPPKLGSDASDADKKAARKLWKLRRDRASREGKLRARATIDMWQERFESGMGGKYFRVGTVKLDDDWKEKRGQLRTLCKAAQDARPETNKWSTWNGIDDI